MLTAHERVMVRHHRSFTVRRDKKSDTSSSSDDVAGKTERLAQVLREDGDTEAFRESNPYLQRLLDMTGDKRRPRDELGMVQLEDMTDHTIV